MSEHSPIASSLSMRPEGRHLSARRLLAALLLPLAITGCTSLAATNTQGLDLRKVGDAAASAGDYALASRAYAKAADEGGRGSKVAMGKMLLRSGKTSEAEAAFTDALGGRDPDAARLGLAQVLLAQGRYDAALGTLEKAGATARARPGLLGAGVALDGLGRHAEAQQRYRAILSADPADKAAINNLSLSLALGGDPEAAITTLTPLATSRAATPRMRQNLALVHALAGNREAAIRVGTVDLPEKDVLANIDALRHRKDG